MQLYPAGALVLILGMISILAIPPSGLFISEILIFRSLVSDGRWFVLISAIVLLCFIVYAMSTRIMHILYSAPRGSEITQEPSFVNPVETVTQFIFLGLVAASCFYQPDFIVRLIDHSIAMLP